MSRILFVAIPEKGHINPMIGPAMCLQRRGHHVRFYAAGDISKQLHAAGLAAIGGATEPTQPPHVNRGKAFAENVRDREWLRAWIRRLLVDEAPAQIGPIKEAIREFAPQAVVTDPMIYAAAIAAHTEEVPWVALSNSLNPVLDDGIRSELLDTVRWLAPAREALFAKYGMNPGFRGCDVLSPHLTIAFTTREFIGRDVPGVEMVGPSLPPGVRGDETDFPWEKLRPPVIYASFGSQIYHQPQLFRLLIEATQHSGFQLVIAVNELLHSDRLGNLPPHVLACHYAPQLAILPKAAAFVTHGGANSVMEALYFGVPLLISPVCNDQFHQAQFVARAGTGCVLDVQTAKLKEVRDELLGLPHDPGVRAALQRVTPSYQKDGSACAAELIEQMATEDRP